MKCSRAQGASCERDANAYVSTLAPLPNWARMLARVSLSLTEYPLVVRISASSRFALTPHSQQVPR
jgi:hypothetical protein